MGGPGCDTSNAWPHNTNFCATSLGPTSSLDELGQYSLGPRRQQLPAGLEGLVSLHIHKNLHINFLQFIKAMLPLFFKFLSYPTYVPQAPNMLNQAGWFICKHPGNLANMFVHITLSIECLVVFLKHNGIIRNSRIPGSREVADSEILNFLEFECSDGHGKASLYEILVADQ